MQTKTLFLLLLPIAQGFLGNLYSNNINKEIETRDSKVVSKVNTIIGTNGMGHTFPGACSPFGLVQLSPDTDTIPHNVDGVYQKNVYEYCAGYQYKDKTIVGFSHTHLSGTGHSDLGDILIMPIVGDLKLNPGTSDNPDNGYRSRFSHNTEKATPGYYEVVLDDYNIKARLTATQRVGVHQYTFPKDKPSHLILDLVHGIYNYDGKVLWANLRVENDTILTGYRITNGWARTNYTYFAVKFSKPIKNYGYVEKDKPLYNGFWRKFKMENNFPEITGRKIVSYFDFDLSKDEVLEVKVALSAVSTEGALLNLTETDGKTFDQIAQITQNKWENELERIEIKGTTDQEAMFYTSLYHTMINPSVYMDLDGKYRGLDHNIHQADNFTNYTVFSLWDTFRAFHPFLNILHPSKNKDMVNSMLAHSSQSVHKALPVWSHMANENWCMIGYHAVSVIADAITKGADIDLSKALSAMKTSSTIPYYGNLKDYISLGYVPFDKDGSAASVTLEYSYDDWAIYNTALKAGNKEMAEEYGKRALNYRNVFDYNIGFARPKYSDGKWKENFSLLNTHNEGFIEGNSWNYSFYVPHDVFGLIDAMGGDKKFVNNLDSLFSMHLPKEFFENTEDVTEEGLMGNYVHGNEPSHHIIYLYAWSSQPWKSQYWIREVMNKMYKNNIDGLCGNDDCGQMSAWYLFSAMGFYPVCPGTDQYVIGAPYLPFISVNLDNGNKIVVKAPNVSDKNRYIKSVKLNGKAYSKSYFTHQDLINGAVIEFEMSSRPNYKRCIDRDSKPYSFTEGIN
ncbi:MAG: GH92 family glycosyl hydrolase [Bacteroidales bacterium]|nr:GH92 family glycosyl hydrolase [Bacteroidales bacterium]